MTRELVIDSFAGGGGASLGIEMALGRPVDIAVNHDREAIAMHKANHPNTKHFYEDIWSVDPLTATQGRPVGLAWFSPDCKHFSKAKGGKPVEKQIRGLAWVALRWAAKVRPRIICLENVEEFRTWGPLNRRHRAKRNHKGETFERWVTQLRDLGYTVEWKELRACDYGAPTIRKRLFVIARCDGEPVVWPVPTHGPRGGVLTPYRTAAECIDWSVRCPSIFERRRPLAAATLRRIAAGIRRYVLDAPEPFIVRTAFKAGNGAYIHAVDEPFKTLTSQADHGLVTPFVAPLTHQGGDWVQSLQDPLSTVTGAHRGEKALIAPLISKFAENGDGHTVVEPLHTVMAGAPRHALVTPFLAGVGGRAGNSPPRTVDGPQRTMTAKADEALIVPTLIQTGYGEREGQEPRVPGVEKPLGTVVSGGKHALVAAFMAKHFTGVVGAELTEPVPTVTATDHNAVVASSLLKLYGTAEGADLDEPMPTVTSGGQHIGEVRAFLEAHYGSEKAGQAVQEPLRSVTAKARFGLVYVEGVPHEIVDIGMRMLRPRELYAAQGFPPGYIIDPIVGRKRLTLTAQIRMCGNAVCPQMSEAIALANYRDGAQREMWKGYELADLAAAGGGE